MEVDGSDDITEISILVIWEGSSCLKFPGCDPESSQTDHDFSSSSMSDVLMSLLHLGGGPPTESCLEKRVDLLILSFGIHHDFGELGCFTYLIPRGSFFCLDFSEWFDPGSRVHPSFLKVSDRALSKEDSIHLELHH